MSIEPRRHTLRPPDLVIGARVLLAFVAIALLSSSFPAAATGLALTVVVIGLDAVDGLLARTMGLTSDLGSVLDITGDRIVEHVYWIYFAVVHLVPLWVPLVIVTRSFVVDTIRGMALARGSTPFGEKTMMTSPLTRFLVASRFMRSAYGVAKVAVFLLLGALIVYERAADYGIILGWNASVELLGAASYGAVLLAVVLNLARGLPVVWDARSFLRHEPS